MADADVGNDDNATVDNVVAVIVDINKVIFIIVVIVVDVAATNELKNSDRNRTRDVQFVIRASDVKSILNKPKKTIFVEKLKRKKV